MLCKDICEWTPRANQCVRTLKSAETQVKDTKCHSRAMFNMSPTQQDDPEDLLYMFFSMINSVFIAFIDFGFSCLQIKSR